MEWLTPETRAVVIEFVLYNANMNLFAVSSMTFEFLNTGCMLSTTFLCCVRFQLSLAGEVTQLMGSHGWLGHTAGEVTRLVRSHGW